jgi:hypothetical protein
VSNTYLGEFLAQLQQEGYSIFIVKGNVSICLFKKEILKLIRNNIVYFFLDQLPECDADLVLQAVPAVQMRPPRLLADVQSSGRGKGRRGQCFHCRLCFTKLSCFFYKKRTKVTFPRLYNGLL